MIVVFFDRDDVLSCDAVVDRAIALTPSAFSAATALQLNVRPSSEIFSDRDHARCAAAARRAVRQFDRSLTGKKLSAPFVVVGRQATWCVANITHRIRRTLRDGRFQVRHHCGRWREAEGCEGVIDALFPRIVDSSSAHTLGGRQLPFAGVYNWLSALGARRARSNGRWIMVSAGLKLGFSEAFTAAGLRIGRISLTTGTRQDYRNLLLGLIGRTNRFLVAPASEADQEYREIVAALAEAEFAFTDSSVRRGWRLYMPYLQRNLLGMLGLVRHGARIIGAADAVGAVSYEANGWANSALLEAARRVGRKAIVVNHNSHASTGGATADSVIEWLYRQRNSSELSTAVVHWTPSDVEMAERVAIDGVSRPYTLSCRLGYPVTSNANGRFKVLHAANYQNWTDFFPWVAETSDEFVEGIRNLSQAAANLPGLDLVIRVRPKSEVNADVIRAVVTQAPNVSVCATEDDFLKQLADSDLLVSFFSTTVAQALQAGRPVLLWGKTKRFHQLPARTSPPTSNDRAAVYAVNGFEQLRPMLAALRDHHGLKPLTAQEIARYRFGESVCDSASVAKMLSVPTRQ